MRITESRLRNVIRQVICESVDNQVLKDKKEFYENLLKKTEIQVNRYWTQLAFSGKGFPPYSLNSNQMQSIINWLKKNPNGIAYSRLDLIPKSAKILYVVEDNS